MAIGSFRFLVATCWLCPAGLGRGPSLLRNAAAKKNNAKPSNRNPLENYPSRPGCLNTTYHIYHMYHIYHISIIAYFTYHMSHIKQIWHLGIDDMWVFDLGNSIRRRSTSAARFLFWRFCVRHIRKQRMLYLASETKQRMLTCPLKLVIERDFSAWHTQQRKNVCERTSLQWLPDTPAQKVGLGMALIQTQR